MLLSPYETIVCASYPVKRLTQSVVRGHLEHPMDAITTVREQTLPGTIMVTPHEHYDDVMALTQPLLVEVGHKKETKWCLDARPFMRYHRQTDSYRLTAVNEFSFQCLRVALIQAAEDDPLCLLRLGDVAIKTFIRWITLGLSQRFNLELEHQIRVSVIAAYYYHTQVTPDRSLSPQEMHQLANQVGRQANVPTPTVLVIADELRTLTDGNALAQALRDHANSIRLSHLEFSDLFAILSASWVGVSARENVGVALEHLPTFIAMVYTGLYERSYRKSMIARRAETVGRQRDRDEFIKAVQRVVADTVAN